MKRIITIIPLLVFCLHLKAQSPLIWPILSKKVIDFHNSKPQLKTNPVFDDSCFEYAGIKGPGQYFVVSDPYAHDLYYASVTTSRLYFEGRNLIVRNSHADTMLKYFVAEPHTATRSDFYFLGFNILPGKSDEFYAVYVFRGQRGMYSFASLGFLKLKRLNRKFTVIQDTIFADFNSQKYFQFETLRGQGADWFIGYADNSIGNTANYAIDIYAISGSGISLSHSDPQTLHYPFYYYISEQCNKAVINDNLYEFNKKTGVFKFEKPLKFSPDIQERDNEMAMFSPSGKYLYYFTGYVDSGIYRRPRDPNLELYLKLYQYDLSRKDTGGNFSYIKCLDTLYIPSNQITGFRYGPDSKIYFIADRSVWCIPYPDKLGKACGLYRTGMQLNAGGYYSLPIVNANPHALSFSYERTCSGIRLKAQGDSALVSYTWTCNGTQYTGINAEVTLRPGKYRVDLEAADTEGLLCWYADTLEVKPLPFKAAFICADSQACAFSPVHFINRSAADSGSMTYVWNFGDGATDTAANAAHLFQKAGAYAVSLIAKQNGCADTFTAPPITITDAPKPGFSVNAAEGCAPFTAIVTDQSQGETINYTLTSGKGDTAHTKGASFTYTFPGSYLIKQQLQGKNGCLSSDSVLIRVHPAIDQNAQVKMQCMSVNENGEPAFSWQGIPSAAGYRIYRADNPLSLLVQTKDTFFSDIVPCRSCSKSAYWFSAIDSCGRTTNPVLYTVPRLRGESRGNEYAILSWPLLQNMPVVQYCLEKQDKQGDFVSLSCSQDTQFRDNSFLNTEALNACYRLSAVLSNGCTARSAPLCIDYEPELYIPDAFSPNGNFVNDSFLVRGIALTHYHITIYNRWGERVFESNDPHQPWTGANCPQDVYYYLIEGTTLKGTLYKRGNVTLLR